MAREPDRDVEELFPQEEPGPAAEPAPSAPERPPERSERTLGHGILSAVAAAIAYLVIPLALVQFLSRMLPLLTLQAGSDLAIIVIGTVLVVAAFCAGYTSQNTKLYSIARLCETGLTILYLFFIFGRGPVLVTLGSIVFTLDITGYFLLLLIGTVLHALSPAWDLVQYLRGKAE